jgi:hypothetical protein
MPHIDCGAFTEVREDPGGQSDGILVIKIKRVGGIGEVFKVRPGCPEALPGVKQALIAEPLADGALGHVAGEGGK